MQAWEFVLGRYQNRWNVFAADIRSGTHRHTETHSLILLTSISDLLCTTKRRASSYRHRLSLSHTHTHAYAPLTALPLSYEKRNEPHGIASWGESNPATDFNKFAERCINRMHAKYPDWKVRGGKEKERGKGRLSGYRSAAL